MILFSTILNINDSLSKDAFVDLVLEWNRTSKYIENVVPNVDLNGSYSGKFGDAKLPLELMDLGMTISDDGKHYKLTYRDDPRYMVTIGKTPSDNRAGNNNAALINKIML